MRSAIISNQLRSFCNVARMALALACALACVAPSARAYVEAPPFRWHEGYLRVTSFTSYYQTNTNYTDNRGEFAALTNGAGSNFKEIDSRLRLRYNLTDYLSFYVGGDFSDAQSHDAILGNKETTAVVGSHAGVDLLLTPDSSWRLVAELEGGASFDQVTYDRARALGSDGAHYGKGMLYLFKPLGWVNLLASAGAKYRSEGLAAQALYSGALEVPFLRRFLVGAGIDGYEAIVSDTFYKTDRKQVVDRVNAGSFRYDGFNDALLQGGGWLGWAPVPSLQIRIGYEQSLMGLRAANGGAAFLALSWNFDPAPDPEGFTTQYAKQREREETRARDATKGFKTEDEATDDSLFYEDVPREKKNAPPPPAAPLYQEPTYQAPAQQQQQYQQQQYQETAPDSYQIQVRPARPRPRARPRRRNAPPPAYGDGGGSGALDAAERKLERGR